MKKTLRIHPLCNVLITHYGLTLLWDSHLNRAPTCVSKLLLCMYCTCTLLNSTVEFATSPTLVFLDCMKGSFCGWVVTNTSKKRQITSMRSSVWKFQVGATFRVQKLHPRESSCMVICVVFKHLVTCTYAMLRGSGNRPALHPRGCPPSFSQSFYLFGEICY